MAFSAPLHPGMGVILQRFEMTETDVARAVEAGELASPSVFANSWYFRIRISGTGFAYRPRLKEYVWRDANLYLTPKFTERCLGLPVVIMHPDKEMLDGQELADRIVGTVVRAWIEGDEVWAVTRILNEAAARYIVDNKLSTSPGVVFLNPKVNEKIEMEDGYQMLVEADPSLLDHVAICPEGVWDKKSGPTGIDVDGSFAAADSTTGGATAFQKDDAMADEEQKGEGEDRRDNGGPGAGPDPMLKYLDSKFDALHKRMDAMDSRMDSLRDDAKKDADDPDQDREQAAELRTLAAEEEEEAEKNDAKRDDAKGGHRMARRDGESRSGHSKRVDARAAKHDAKHARKRADESEDEHSERIDAACRRDAAEDEDKAEKKAEEDRKDAKRDDARRDAKRDDAKRDDAKRDDDRRDDDKRDDRRHDARRDDARRDDDRRDDQKRDDAKRDDARHDSKGPDLSRFRRDLDAHGNLLEELRLTLNRPGEEQERFAAAQQRADDVYTLFDNRAPAPLVGESLAAYRVRLARPMLQHSKAWKDADLTELAQTKGPAFDNAEQAIYADAATVGRHPGDPGSAQLRKHVRIDPDTGQRMVEWFGSPKAWMSPMMNPFQVATRLGGARKE